MKSHSRIPKRIPVEGIPALTGQRVLWLALALFLCAVPAAPQTLSGAVSLTVRRQGIQPASPTVSAGKVLIHVSNRLGLGSLSLQILNSSSSQVAAIQLARGHWESTTPVTFAAGTYTVHVTNWPSLSAVITVKP